MKKILIVLIIFLFLLNGISALQINMPDKVKQGQTLIAKISGNFYDPISKENIFLYKKHIRIPFSFEIEKIQNNYYLYSQLDKKPGNYSLLIKNVKYFKNNNVIDKEIKKDFSIENNTADFFITPGFISTQENFSINIENLQDNEINININTDLTDKNSIKLSAKNSKKIDFNINNIEKTIFKKINISSQKTLYEIPVYIISGKNIPGKKSMVFYPSDFDITIPTNSSIKRIIYLYNDGNKDFENVNLYLSDSLKNYINIPSKIPALDSDESEEIVLNIFSEHEKTLKGNITAKIENTYAYSSLSLNFVKDYEFSPEENKTEIAPDPASLSLCSEMNGKICADNEECSGKEEFAKDGKCCLGSCVEKQTSSSGKILGWILIAIVVILLVFFFLKYKKVKNPINLLKIAKGKKFAKQK